MQWKIAREREAEAPQSEPRKHWPATGLNHEFWPPFMPSLTLIGCWGERGYGPAQRRESNCRLGPQPKQSEICVSCCCFFCPPFRHKFARPRVVGTSHHPTPTTHPPPLFFARSFLGRRSLSLSLFHHFLRLWAALPTTKVSVAFQRSKLLVVLAAQEKVVKESRTQRIPNATEMC